MKEFRQFFLSGLVLSLLVATLNAYGQAVLPETSRASPALAKFADPASHSPPSLWIAWTGTNSTHNLNILESADGVGWDDNYKAVLPESGSQGPALASHNGLPLCLAWAGTDSDHHLNVAFSYDGHQFEGKVVLGETSFHSPALAYSGDALVLAWTGADGHLNVASLGMPGANFGEILNKVTLYETSDRGPAIAAAGPRLYLAWSGTDSQHSLNVIKSDNGGADWVGKATLHETTAMQPALVISSHPGPHMVYLAWTGTDPAHHLNYVSAPLGNTFFSGKQTINQTSATGPALAEFRGGLYISWTGTDSANHLNVAPF